jgi:hypothetical protein
MKMRTILPAFCIFLLATSEIAAKNCEILAWPSSGKHPDCSGVGMMTETGRTVWAFWGKKYACSIPPTTKEVIKIGYVINDPLLYGVYAKYEEVIEGENGTLTPSGRLIYSWVDIPRALKPCRNGEDMCPCTSGDGCLPTVKWLEQPHCP